MDKASSLIQADYRLRRNPRLTLRHYLIARTNLELKHENLSVLLFNSGNCIGPLSRTQCRRTETGLLV